MRNIISVSGLVLCAMLLGCGKEPLSKESVSISTIADMPSSEEPTPCFPEFVGDPPLLVLRSAKQPILVGESVEVRELLFYPGNMRCRASYIWHSLHGVLIPEEEDAARFLAMRESKVERIPQSVFSGKIRFEDAGTLQEVRSDPKEIGWGGIHTGEGGVGREILPGLISETYSVRFDKPATYLLGSEWHFCLNEKETRLRAYLLITVADKRSEKGSELFIP